MSYPRTPEEQAGFRAAVLREAAGELDAHASQLADVSDDPAAFVAKTRVRAATEWRVAAELLRRLAAVAPEPATQDEAPTSTAPLAAGLPLVKGNCPACRGASLFLGTGGYPTCSNADCPEPDAATTVLEQYANEAHPPSHAWKVESPRRDTWTNWGATHDERVWAAASYEDAIGTAPQRPFRLVRATTTYVVEAEHPSAAVPAGQTDEEA